MRRLWQVFSAPEGMDVPLDDGVASPWTFPEQVRIPMEHWDAIIAFARRRDEGGAALLERVSVLDGAALNAETRARFLTVLETLAEAVPRAPGLTPDDADPASIPEPMPNSSHATMLRDVIRLVRHVEKHGAAFDSWVD